jgi:hypothetical protein
VTPDELSELAARLSQAIEDAVDGSLGNVVVLYDYALSHAVVLASNGGRRATAAILEAMAQATREGQTAPSVLDPKTLS